MLGRGRPAVVSPGTDLNASARMQLIVTDIDAARAELSGRGVDVSDVQILDARDGGKFCYFTDPDGNNWAVQEVRNYVGAPLDERRRLTRGDFPAAGWSVLTGPAAAAGVRAGKRGDRDDRQHGFQPPDQ